MRALCRERDWTATSLGAPSTWPPTLRTIVRAALDSPFPVNLWCGAEPVLIYNDAYAPVLGTKHPAALGRPGREVWAEIWPEIKPMFEQIRAGGPSIYAEDAPFLVRRAGGDEGADDGPNAWFTFALSAVRDEAGEIVAFLNIVSETTARIRAERAREEARAKAERAEARLRDVFAQAPAFMAVVRGREHIFEYVNEAYYQLVGHRELIGRPVFEALPEVRGQGFEDLLDNVLDTGEPFIGREVPVLVQRTPDGEPEHLFVDVVYYPIREADGTRSGVVAHGSDVTEHVLARREAQRATAAAEQANRAKSQFLANMSHEIRTPINAVVGYTDLLDAGVAGELSPPQQEYVTRIRESSVHLLDLVSEVLDFAKIEAGEMAVESAEVPIAQVIGSAVAIVSAEAAARDLALVEEWECDRSVRFLGAEQRTRQILLNLLSNAFKFTLPGGTVTLRCRTAKAPAPDSALQDRGPWIVVEVEDTGIGIPDQHIARIFEPFVQVEEGHTRRAGGTGLGLSISRRLARMMGGDVTVRSAPGHGSVFALWLPVSDQGDVVPSSAER